MIEDIIQRLKSEAVTANVLLLAVGSVGRGDDDEYSDLDIVCIYQDGAQPLYPEGTLIIDNKICGFRNVPLSFLQRRNFSQQEKHAYYNSRIIFDPADVIKGIISDKCVWEENERLNLFCDHLVKLSYTLNLINNYKNCWNGCKDLKKSISRHQHLLATQLRLQVLEHSISLALIKDGVFIPPLRTLYSRWTASKSLDAKKILEVAEEYDLATERDVRIFEGFLQSHVSRIVRDFEKDVSLPDNIYSYRLGVTRRYD